MTTQDPLAPCALQQEHRALMCSYAQVQRRCSRQMQRQQALIRHQSAEIMRLRAALIVQTTRWALERDARCALEQAHPDLPRRLRLVQDLSQLQQRYESAQRAQQQWQQRCEQWMAATQNLGAPLRAKSVLWIGTANGPAQAAQRAVERSGGRYLPCSPQQAESDDQALSRYVHAADLVLCQTGCLSHGAYWRVQDHCQRTGKPCVMVDPVVATDTPTPATASPL